MTYQEFEKEHADVAMFVHLFGNIQCYPWWQRYRECKTIAALVQQYPEAMQRIDNEIKVLKAKVN